MGQTSQPDFTQRSADLQDTAGGQDTGTAGFSEPPMTAEESAEAARRQAERKAKRKADKAAALASANGDGPA